MAVSAGGSEVVSEESFAMVSADSWASCGLRTASAVTCWGLVEVEPTPSERFTTIHSS